MADSSRPSLRGLARELGTSHQLLMYYLQTLPKWEAKEHLRLAMKILARAKAENRPMTPQEYRQWLLRDTQAYIAFVAYQASKTLVKAANFF